MPKQPSDLWVYMSGPITGGDTIRNIREAIRVAERIMCAGMTAICPHLAAFWHIHYPHTHAEWLAHDFALLKRCDVLLRLDGESPGAEMEIHEAIRLDLQVFHLPESDGWTRLLAWRDDQCRS